MTANCNRIDLTPAVRSSWLAPAALTCAAAAVVGLSGLTLLETTPLPTSVLPVALHDHFLSPVLSLNVQQVLPAICTAAGAYLHSLWTTPAPLDGMNHDFQKTEPNPRKWDPETALAAVQQNGEALKEIPKELITDEIALAAINQDRSAMKFVPKKLITPKFARAAVERDPWVIQYMPQEKINREIALTAVRHPRMIPFVPKELIPEIALAAVKRDGFALEFVPKEQITHEIALAAIQRDARVIQSRLPQELITPKLALAAVQRNPRAIQYLSQELINNEIALAAAKQDGFALKYVPKEQITHEIALKAVQNRGSALEFVPKELCTDKIALAAVKSNGFALEFVPKELLTEEIVLTAVQNHGRALQFAPKEILTDEIVLTAAKQDGFALKYVPKEQITHEIALEAVQKNWEAIKYIPEEVLTEEIALEAVQQDWWAINYIPKEVLTEEIALEAVQQDWWAIKYIPEEVLTEKIALAAVQQHYAALLSLPEQVITDAVIDLALGERSDIPSFVQQQSLAQQLDQPPIIANPQSIAPTTGPLPAALQSFLDQHLLTDKELTSDHLESQGFERIAEATLKEVWIHPSLPGYVLKISHDRAFSKHHSSYALIQDALTMRHLQTLVDEHNLSHVHIPETYLVMNENQGVMIQERVQIEKSAPETEGLSQLKTLIQLMDQKFYPLISDVVKKQPKDKIVEIVQKLVKIAYQRPLSPKFQQFIERAWVWDLAPEDAHNAGSTKEFPEDIFILDGGL